MNHRQRFNAQMHYEPVDRPPLYDFNTWNETIPAWHAQGMPTTFTRRNIEQYFGLDASLGGGWPHHWTGGANTSLCPPFETRVIEDRGETHILMQEDGVIVEAHKTQATIPSHVGHTLTDRESWRTQFKPKLDPANPDRYPRNWDDCVRTWTDPQRDHPVFIHAGSLFGKLRDWMGLEQIALVVYDDPAWFQEMVETMADMSVAVLSRILETGAKVDAAAMWEDMCFNAGPLLSPTHFKQYLSPHYRRITDLLHKHDVDVIWLDCDGWIDPLLPLWLDAGVNCMFPIEIGSWGADPVKYRREFGRDLLMMGGFDKHILAQSKDAIEAEVRRLAPLIEEGGFIGFCDHRVPPDVSLDHYSHWARCVRGIWAHGLDLPPAPALAAPPASV